MRRFIPAGSSLWGNTVIKIELFIFSKIDIFKFLKISIFEIFHIFKRKLLIYTHSNLITAQVQRSK